MTNSKAIDAVKYIMLVFWTFIVLFPMTIVLFTSFKTDAEYIRTSVFQLPDSFLNFKNYYNAFVQGNFPTAFKNSFSIVFVGIMGNVVLGTMTAYCLSRFDFRFSRVIKFLYVLAAIIPSVSIQVSVYVVLKNLHLTGTFFAPALLYITTDMIQIWIFLQYLEKIPVSLDESAMIDGASYFRIFCTIIFPLLIPAISTVVILKAVSIYNDMFTQYLYMSSPQLRTVTTALQTFQGISSQKQNLMTASIIMVMIPTILLFLFFQKYIFSGITAGSIKE